MKTRDEIERTTASRLAPQDDESPKSGEAIEHEQRQRSAATASPDGGKLRRVCATSEKSNQIDCEAAAKLQGLQADDQQVAPNCLGSETPVANNAESNRVAMVGATESAPAPALERQKLEVPGKLLEGESKQARGLTQGPRQDGPCKPLTVTKSATIENQVARVGRTRHIIAILALSSIVLANMNRQAYNQALVRMIRRGPKVALSDDGAGDNLTLTSTVSMLVGDAALYAATSTPAFAGWTSDPTASETIANETTWNEAESVKPTTVLDATATRPPPATGGAATEEEEDGDGNEVGEGFDWTGAQISLLQAAFSYGYTFFMIPGGRLSEIYGAKWVVFLSSFGSALCSLVTPLLAKASFVLLVASRVFMGLCQTGVTPALYALFSRWLPPDESSVYLPMIKVGVMLGLMFGSLINGFLPWPIMFYILGALGLVWSALWAFYASSLPRDHKFIASQEQEYIQHCLARRSPIKTKEEPVKRGESAPWFRIIKNPVVLAFTFTKFTVKLSTDTQTMQIPMYLRNVFQISDQLNGLLNGANFAIQAIFTGVVAYTAKEMVLRQQFGLHKTGIRRLFQGINCFGMALAYLLISFNMGSLNLVCGAVILLSVSSMFCAGGEAVLPIDLTTEYSASIMAIANSVANLSGIVLPPIVSFFLADQLTSSESWNHVWWFISVIMSCGGLAFTLVVKAKIQGFNEGKKAKNQAQPNGSSTDLSKADKADSWIVIEMTQTKKH